MPTCLRKIATGADITVRAGIQTWSNEMYELLGLLLLVIYFVPTIIADRRTHPNRRAILTVNLPLGWTLIGWVVALAWSQSAFRRQEWT